MAKTIDPRYPAGGIPTSTPFVLAHSTIRPTLPPTVRGPHPYPPVVDGPGTPSLWRSWGMPQSSTFVMAVAPTTNTPSSLGTAEASSLASGNEPVGAHLAGPPSPTEAPLTPGSQPALVSPVFLGIAVVGLILQAIQTFRRT